MTVPRRTYNQWVANETMEDFALRFTARRARKWSPARVANTAIGSISFLALEAIGGAITLSYGFENAVIAILAVGAVLFLTGLPISYHAAKSGVDIDLLTRGAGFGYIGSTITSLIYASFTFIFFALEAAILSFALELCFGVPLAIGYLLNALIVIPLVSHGFTRIGAFQKWTQPVWVVLHVLPFLLLLWVGVDFESWIGHEGRLGDGGFDLVLFAAASGVIFSLAAQIGEQVDFLRFLPEPKTPAERLRWWAALIAAGPGWAVLGTVKMLAGSLLAVLALEAGVLPEMAGEPTHMYLSAYESALPWPTLALVLTGIFVVVSQLKINVTNAYAGSIAWSNFFSRLTHQHPGRVVWLCFNVAIALTLMEFGVFGALERTLGLYSLVAVAWIGAITADLVINKPLGLSPPGIEFRRAHLFDINPVGVGAMSTATILSLAAYLGAFGPVAEAMSSAIALGTALVVAPCIAWLTRGRYYIARQPDPQPASPETGIGTGTGTGASVGSCTQCGHSFDQEDMAYCPFHEGSICSLCCTLDARCGDRCKPAALPPDGRVRRWLTANMPRSLRAMMQPAYGLFAAIIIGFLTIILAAFLLIHQQVSIAHPASADAVERALAMAFAMLVLVTGIAAWLHVLALESRTRALAEGEKQADRLRAEIEAHKETDAALQKAKDEAEAANHAKSRYVVGISHELRTPLNAILGYAQLMEGDPTIPTHRQTGVSVIRRSAEHLGGLIEGLLDISQIEAGRLAVYRDDVRFGEFLSHIAAIFRMEAAEKNLSFRTAIPATLPPAVHGDEKRLRQILMNLLSNAIRYTDEGEIRFTVGYANEVATFTIADTGRGIAPEERERIFQPFQRIENPSAPVRGTGLGLTITKLLTEMQGGELTLDSTPGKGSIFRVRLLLPRIQHALPASAGSEQAIIGYHGPRRRVLVIDDNPEHRLLVRDALAPIGLEVALAETGSAAIAMISVSHPDILLVDVALPGEDGWHLARRLRMEHGVTAPILMVSAHALVRHRPQTPGAMHDAFISKPIKIDELLATIGRHLQLTWCYRGDALPERAADPAEIARPAEALMTPLREALCIHHAQGVRSALGTIETAAPDCAEFVCRATKALDDYDFAALAALVGEKPR
ncbi:MAG: ATP-binding protein [Pseudomonadota bacterium]